MSALDPSDLCNAAEAATGCHDWGEPEFREGLEQLCASARNEARLDPPREAALAGQIGSALGNRLRIYADRTRYPEIALQEIVAPIFVIGFPRSGTTILHALLAADPRARSPEAWELSEPSPPPCSESELDDERIARTQARIDALPATFRAMHAMGARLPEEDNAIMQLAFRSLNFEAGRPLPSYLDWLLACEMAPAFALHRHVLQHLQAFRPRHWWVLKAPPHLFCLAALFAAYPDARVVFTHRDPAAILASNASLIAFIREMNGSVVDRPKLALAETAKWAAGMERAMAFRGARPDLTERFLDVQYADFIRDPLSIVATIYAWLGIDFTEPARAAMDRFMADNRQDKHGAHIYSAGDYAIEPATVRAQFADYMSSYSVPEEASK